MLERMTFSSVLTLLMYIQKLLVIGRGYGRTLERDLMVFLFVDVVGAAAA